MDIKSLNSYGASLLDYLGQGKTGNNFFAASAQNILNSYGNGLQAADSALAESQNVSVTLSEDAKKLLADGADPKSKLTGVQKGAASFMMSFFDQSGLDLEKLSPEVLDLLSGLQGVIGGIDATGRDLQTDNAENKYSNGAKKAYTLTGNAQRLRVGIEYDPNGKPLKLSVTDISGGAVETAAITLGKDEDGVMAMTIERTQRHYTNGHMVALDPIDPLTVTLYSKA